jgi:Na+-driven multidrug efflux pump
MKDLTTGSVTRHLVHMSAFLAMSMAVQTLYLLADLYWVGHLGKEAIAAVGVAGNITMIVLALTQMLGVGTTTLIAQAAGRRDQVRAELVFNQSFVMSIVIASPSVLSDSFCARLIVIGSVRMRRRRRWQGLTCSGFFLHCYCNSRSWLWARHCAPQGSSSRLSDSKC